MKAIIVAAGCARRMNPMTDRIPKCMIELNGKKIVEFQIEVLRSCGINEIVIITGHGREYIKDFLKQNFLEIYNPQYSKFGNLTSYASAYNQVYGDFISLYSDIIFAPSLLTKLLKANGDICIALEQKVCDEEDMKVNVKNRKIVRFGKNIAPDDAFGEFIGIFKANMRGASLIRKELAKHINKNDLDHDFNIVFDNLIRQGEEITYCKINGELWVEIDCLDDLKFTKKEILPYL